MKLLISNASAELTYVRKFLTLGRGQVHCPGMSERKAVLMADVKPQTIPRQRSEIKEIVVEGTIGMAQRGVTIEDVVSIRFEPAREMAIGDCKAKYHVLYRA